jgi:hypothetical protein
VCECRIRVYCIDFLLKIFSKCFQVTFPLDLINVKVQYLIRDIVNNV